MPPLKRPRTGNGTGKRQQNHTRASSWPGFLSWIWAAPAIRPKVPSAVVASAWASVREGSRPQARALQMFRQLPHPRVQALLGYGAGGASLAPHAVEPLNLWSMYLLQMLHV